MSGISPINTLKRYSQPIFETNNPPPKKFKMEESNINLQFNQQMKNIDEISRILDDKNKFLNPNEKMEIELTNENNSKTINLISNDKLGYLEGITKNI